MKEVEMRDQDEPARKKRHLSELFTALKAVVAANPNLQELIRAQEQDNRQVLLNMSSVLRMVERDRLARAQGMETERYEPRVVAGWMRGDGTLVHGRAQEAGDVEAEPVPEPDDSDGPTNFFDRAFLKSLKISS
jgi:hypothetical protein